jgi:nitrite reductase/ring-hydroxylating ferredoxin subunit
MKFLCAGADLAEAKSRGFEIDGNKLFAVRRSGQAYVYLNRCPHRGVRVVPVSRPEQQPDPVRHPRRIVSDRGR